ncbi:uncharacterized protein LOC123194270 isoform X3 [Mangifera indica]|uniref:uncharacterized protein LOC123194270 isoform X3 n=1 Tax=Mangifera indica TaxID=29780 RepID=UPI001CFBF1CC|nr:uncharacterized protein LOC123194270 isoform X3 [Mangifera indica]
MAAFMFIYVHGGFMEEGENISGAIYEDDNLEDFEDVEMLDVEEGELLEHDASAQTNFEQSHAEDVIVANVESQSKNRQANKKKKRKKKKRSGVGPKFTDINRFVSDTCKHLKERKSYMVYTAVCCLGVSALSDLIKETLVTPNHELWLCPCVGMFTDETFGWCAKSKIHLFPISRDFSGCFKLCALS